MQQQSAPPKSEAETLADVRADYRKRLIRLTIRYALMCLGCLLIGLAGTGIMVYGGVEVVAAMEAVGAIQLISFRPPQSYLLFERMGGLVSSIGFFALLFIFTVWFDSRSAMIKEREDAIVVAKKSFEGQPKTLQEALLALAAKRREELAKAAAEGASSEPPAPPVQTVSEISPPLVVAKPAARPAVDAAVKAGIAAPRKEKEDEAPVLLAGIKPPSPTPMTPRTGSAVRPTVSVVVPGTSNVGNDVEMQNLQKSTIQSRRNSRPPSGKSQASTKKGPKA